MLDLHRMCHKAVDALERRAQGLEAELVRCHEQIGKLEAQLRMVMEDRFLRPVVTDPAAAPVDNEVGTIVLPDVTQFDDEGFLAQVDRIAEATKRNA